MGTPQGVVRVRRECDCVQVQVEGWGTMVQSLPLRRYVEQCLSQGVTRLRLDLASCQYLDSTFVGTLFLLRRSLQRHSGTLSLDRLSAPVQNLLKQMGVEGMFPLLPGADLATAPWQDLTCVGAEVQSMQRNVVQAHQELAGVEGRCGETFRPVAECLARETGEKT